MSKLDIIGGTLDVITDIFIQDTTGTDGEGLTGLVFNDAGLTCYYTRAGAAAVQLALANVAVAGAHANGGFVEVSAANMPGVYRLDLSDAMVAAGVTSVFVLLKGAANMASTPFEIQIT